MTATSGTLDHQAIANEVVSCLGQHRQIATFSSRPAGLSLAQAYRVTPLLRAAFETRGEKIIGRKIGFTNREMWKVYGVTSPVWGYVTDHTTFDLSATRVMRVTEFAEPRIEPEIIFGLRKAPLPGMGETELLDCLEWISLGFEIVQSIYPGWKFGASDTVAANGVHGALLVGPRHSVETRQANWVRELGTFTIELHCNGEVSQRGGGALVLGSPLVALHHLVELLANDPHNPPLRADEVVTTGTLTLAMSVSPGESWTAKASGIPLDEEIGLRFE
jgi:2-oxo-3-hexenedioate decarboxylase